MFYRKVSLELILALIFLWLSPTSCVNVLGLFWLMLKFSFAILQIIMDTFKHWPLHIECMRISVYCGSYLQSISTTTATTAHMPHAARRFAHLSRHYTQLWVEVGLLVYFRLLRLYCQPCPMLWLSKRLFSLPFAFQFRHFFFQLFFSRCLLRNIVALFHFSDTPRPFSLLHMAFKPFSIWHCRYGPFIMILLISLFRLKTTLGNSKFRMRRRNTLPDTSPLQMSKCNRGSLRVDRALDLHKYNECLCWACGNGGMGASLASTKYSNETRHCQHFIVSSRSTWRSSWGRQL